MIDLREKQKKLQRESYTLLKEKIDSLQKGQTNELAKASNMLSYIQKLTELVDEFKREMLQEVIGKIIRQDESIFCKKMGVEYKNIDDVLAKPLAIMVLEKKITDLELEELHKSKKKFEELSPEVLKKRLDETKKYLLERIGLGRDIYALLGKDDIEKEFKDMPHRVALALHLFDSNSLIVTFMSSLLSLKNIDNDDVENTGNTRQTFGSHMGEKLHFQLAWRFLREIEEVEEKKLKELHREYINENLENITQLSIPLWSTVIENEIGQKLIDLAIKANIINEYRKPNDEGNFNYLKLDKSFLEKMNQNDKKITLAASMIYQPMVIEPLDWKGLYGGGFLPDDEEGERRFDLSLIKTSSKKDREALKGKMIPSNILESINHLQKTAFSINEKMLEVLLDYHNDINYLKKENRVDFSYYRILREILNSNIYKKSIKEIHKHFKNTKFIKVSKGELSATDKRRIDKGLKSLDKIKDIEAYKYTANIYYDIAKYKQGFDSIVQIAQKMKAYKKFHFVWRMDFRGRVYPEQTLLNPQAGDLPKSLLLFTEKKSLTEEGYRWFYIHGANCYGEVDKESYDNRIAWVKNHEKQILSCAKDYRDEDFWKKAGDPFKFLAWCFEYARYKEKPDNFQTAIPVAIDGSNNGFQHITALLKDTQGAKKVNVLPFYDENNELVVADFYADVAQELKKLLQKSYDSFQSKKEDYFEKDGVFYEKKEFFSIDVNYHLEAFIKPLEEFDSGQLKNGLYYSTVLNEDIDNIFKKSTLSKKEIEPVKDELLKIERRVRKDVGDDDLEEIKFSMIEEIEKVFKRANRHLKSNKTREKDGKVLKPEIKDILIVPSLYKNFLENNLINRNFVKKPVMTESYGSSSAGKAKKILEDIESNGVVSHFDEALRYKIAMEITKLLEEALTIVSSSPGIYKKWMKSYAQNMAKKSAIRWDTPLGMEVKQVDFKAKKVKVPIGNRRDVTFKIYSNEIDKNGHQKGLSPNFIHSLDASHLMVAVNNLAKKGVTDIVTVHDSFATHANDVGKMSLTLREMFIELHKKEILEDFKLYAKENFDVNEKKTPYVDKEGFNLKDVLKSEYFFC